MNRKVMAFVVCTLIVPFAHTQISPDVKGATASVKNLDMSRNTALVEILNTSNKDIAAYTVAVEAVYANGYKAKSELMQDYGPTLTARGEGLHPNATNVQSTSWQAEPTTSLVTVNVKVTAVVYADRTDDNNDPDALGRVVEHRNSTAMMSHKSVEALETALSDQTNEHPGAKAAAIMNAIPSASLPSGIGRAYVKALVDDFEAASQHASKRGISEREFLTQHLNELKRRAADEAQYAQIGGKP